MASHVLASSFQHGDRTPPQLELLVSESYLVLKDEADAARVGPMADHLARRALRVTAGGDFDVAQEALAAMIRRLQTAREDVWHVRSGEGVGGYRVSRRGRADRHYDVWIADPVTLDGSCTCPDYAKASLGICKHMFAVLERGRATRAGLPRALRWDPVRPMSGVGDWFERVYLDPAVSERLPKEIAAAFQRTTSRHPIEPAAIARPRDRLALADRLLRLTRGNPLFAEPALRGLLERECTRLEERLAWTPTTGERTRVLRGLKVKLFPYQLEGVQRFLAAGRLLLADDMGLGKTAQAIASAHALVRAGQVTRALIVVPASLKPQWQREWAVFTDLPITPVDGHPEQRAATYRAARGGTSVLLVNYEQLLRDLPLVQSFAPDLVILDEAQRIKNWQTKTAAVVKQLTPRWRLVLTGTPMENRLDELASIMEWVDEQALEPRWRLASWHAVRADGAREVVGARNLETLRTRLAPGMLRRIRQEVLAQLPARRDMTVGLTLTPEQVSAHTELDQPIARIASRARTRPLTRGEFLQLMQLMVQQRMICNGLALRDFESVWPDLERTQRRSETILSSLASPKLLELRDRIFDLTVTQGRKVVVFSQWRRMLQLAAWATADVLGAAGVRTVFFSGEESQRRRAENLVDFHDDPRTRVLFATDAGGVGLNLQRAATSCINLELPWNPAVLEQRIGRIYRLGQTHPIDVYNLVAASGIEARIAKLVGDKRALFKGLFDGTTDEIAFEGSGSFIEQIRKLADVEPESDAEILPEEEPAVFESPPPAAPATIELGELASMMSDISIRPLEGGRVSLEMPRQAASALAGMLRSLAQAVEGGAVAQSGRPMP